MRKRSIIRNQSKSRSAFLLERNFSPTDTRCRYLKKKSLMPNPFLDPASLRVFWDRSGQFLHPQENVTDSHRKQNGRKWTLLEKTLSKRRKSLSHSCKNPRQKSNHCCVATAHELTNIARTLVCSRLLEKCSKHKNRRRWKMKTSPRRNTYVVRLRT